MSLARKFKLNSGYEIPAVGLGTWLSQPKEVTNAVDAALRAGYRHIDAAAIYENETEVGEGWKRSGVPREEIFITSKLWNTHHHPDHVEAALDKTLKDLQTDYLDLYLIHWPVSFVYRPDTLFPKHPESGLFQLANIPVRDTWAAMERLVSIGKVRSIGISNFTIQKTKELLETARIAPAINQVEAHPWLQQAEFTGFMREKNILIEAYSPLGNNIYGHARVVDDPTIQQIARKLNVDPARMLISLAVQRGTVVLPKSVTPSRIQSNFQDFIIPDQEFKELSKLDKHYRFNFPFDWGVDIFGEVGQPEVEARAVAEAAKA